MVTRKAEMLKTVKARSRKLKIKIGENEVLLHSYVVNSITINLRFIYVSDNRKGFCFIEGICPDFHSILPVLGLGNTTIHLSPQTPFELD